MAQEPLSRAPGSHHPRTASRIVLGALKAKEPPVINIHPVKLARFGLALTVDAAADYVSWLQEGLGAVEATLGSLAAKLDPGEEYVPLVKPLLDYLADDQWGESDFELARTIIDRTRGTESQA